MPPSLAGALRASSAVMQLSRARRRVEARASVRVSGSRVDRRRPEHVFRHEEEAGDLPRNAPQQGECSWNSVAGQWLAVFGQRTHAAPPCTSPGGRNTIAAIRTRHPLLVKSTRQAGLATCGLIFLATFSLEYLFFSDNFSVAYVVAHSNRSLSPFYKVAALWSGQEGSLLFWSWLLAGYGLVFGAIVGALFGLLAHALQRGQRDFHSISGLRPKYYDVVADVEVADRALQLLASSNRKE